MGCTHYVCLQLTTALQPRYIITGTQSGRGFDIPHAICSRGLAAANALEIHLFIAFADFGNK
jgi:hypothetical protein